MNAAIVELLRDGLSDRAVAREVGVNTRRVRAVRETHGLPVHPRCVVDQPMREQLRTQYEAIFGRTA